MITRQEVYDAIDTERDYQDVKWPGHTHSPEEFLLYMQDYMDEARHTLSREDGKTAYPKAMEIMRKITAMGVACMEEHGAPPRLCGNRLTVGLDITCTLQFGHPHSTGEHAWHRSVYADGRPCVWGPGRPE